MPIGARFAHASIVARDWRRLARFYEQVFGCVVVPPERDLSGQWLADATGVPNAHIRGIHLRLPGHGDRGPTLEVFQYAPWEERLLPVINAPGLAHLAFAVEDVELAREEVRAAGGIDVGSLASPEIQGAGKITFVYVRDPEGNIIELQRWL
jgi:catechol 2,3-dioxygenase-like lactoylglutathione lyase family enzyme